MQVFDNKADVEYFAKSVAYEAISANDYNLSVSSYVEAKDTREKIDITKLNAELKTTVAKIDQLRTDYAQILMPLLQRLRDRLWDCPPPQPCALHLTRFPFM